MTSVPRLTRILLASSFALAAFAAAPALAEPAAPAPVPVPYPNTPPPDASSQNAAARDAATGLPTGKRMHKPYAVTTSAVQPASCDTLHAQPTAGVASDPEEGGQIAARKAHVGEMTVTKHADAGSAKLMDAAPADGATCR